VRVGRQRDRVARVDDHLEEREVGVQLADGLAQAGGRHLDGDPRVGDALHRPVVEAAQVALGPRALGAPDLHEVGVGEHVEQAALRRRPSVSK
jgi:hypothetical protein